MASDLRGRMRAKWLVGVVAGLVLGAGVASAATYTTGSPGQLAMAPGDSVHVTCAGPSLSYGNASATSGDLTCAPMPTTTVAPPTTTAAPTTTAPAPKPPPSAFPDATNTGVPAGTTLTTYTGPTTITSCGVVLSSYLFPNGITVKATNGGHDQTHPCVTITNSKIVGVLFVGYSGTGPTVVTDTEIVGTAGSTTPPLWQYNFYGYRLNVHGGRGQVDCDGWCELHDSWVHDEDYAGATHMQAFETNGQTAGGNVLLEHNTFDCNPHGTATNGGGCAADVSFFGDNATISGSTVDRNLFVASTGQFGWCVYTGASEPSKHFPTGTNLTWSNNVFQRGPSGKCGDSGPVADWAYNTGNVWSGNTWDDGTPLTP